MMSVPYRWTCRSILALIAALAIWIGFRANQAHKQESAIQYVLNRGGDVGFNWQFDNANRRSARKGPPVPSCLRDVIPDSYFQRVVYIRVAVSDAEDLQSVARLRHLRALHVSQPGSMQLADISPLSRSRELEDLSLGGCERVTDLTPLSMLTKLRRLDLEATAARDLSPLTSLVRLEELNLTDTEVEDLSPLESLVNLRKLSLRGARSVSDLSPLVALRYLHSLDITYTMVVNPAPLAHLKGLRELRIDSEQLTQKEITELGARLPGCNVVVAH